MTNQDTFDEFKSMFDVPVERSIISEEHDFQEEGMEEFDKLVVDVSDVIELAEEDESVVEDIVIEKKLDKEEEEKREEEPKQENIENDKKMQWLLKSPSTLYNEFYSLKKEMINKCTPRGFLPFEELTQELLDCHVNIKTEVFDNTEYIRQMEKIQNYMERVKNIQIRCNNQYFLWEVFIPNLKGCLARVEYLKPAIKQDGLIHCHMKDMQWYFGNLEHLHESSKGVMKTLEKAFETISRKASLTSPAKPIERYKSRQREETIENNKTRQDLSNYDDLPNNASVKRKKGNSFCEWEDIG